MTPNSHRSSFLTILVLLYSLFIPISAPSQSQADSTSRRRVVLRTAPAYPALARSMALTGVVRVEVVVSPDGSAKTVGVKGGHPVLTQAVVNAVHNWKWEPAAHESRELVEVKFSPE
ncbi:MAG: TonB family protein [Terriglobales bacterium]